jgi:hypothetical protein
MARANRGKQIGNTVVLPRTTSAGLGQMRCPFCRGLALPVASKDPKARAVCQCTSCGRTLSSKPF